MLQRDRDDGGLAHIGRLQRAHLERMHLIPLGARAFRKDEQVLALLQPARALSEHMHIALSGLPVKMDRADELRPPSQQRDAFIFLLGDEREGDRTAGHDRRRIQRPLMIRDKEQRSLRRKVLRPLHMQLEAERLDGLAAVSLQHAVILFPFVHAAAAGDDPRSRQKMCHSQYLKWRHVITVLSVAYFASLSAHMISPRAATSPSTLAHTSAK